jgi:hypothetical protein
VHTSPDCAYVGHSFAPFRILGGFCAAMVRLLFEKQGHSVRTMEDKIRGNLDIPYTVTSGIMEYTYRTTANASFILKAITPDINGTYEDLALLFYTDLMSLANTVQYDLIELRWKGKESGASPRVVIDLTAAKVHMSHMSYASLQNRTTAKTGTADESSMLDVANNPLEGKSYSGSGTGAQIRFNNSAITLLSGFVCDTSTGSIEFNVNGPNVEPEMYTILRRPPLASAFGYVKKSGKVRLSPGSIRKSVLKFQRSMGVNNFMYAMRNYMNQTVSTDIRIPMGSFQFFAFEKLCNTDTDEPDITIGMEVNQTYRTYITEGFRGITATQIVY